MIRFFKRNYFTPTYKAFRRGYKEPKYGAPRPNENVGQKRITVKQEHNPVKMEEPTARP